MAVLGQIPRRAKRWRYALENVIDVVNNHNDLNIDIFSN